MERLQSVSRYCGGPCSWGGTCVYLLVVRWLRRPLPYALPQGDPPEPGGGVGGAIAVVVGVRAAPADQWHAPLVVVLAALSLLSSESERRQRTSGTHLWWWCWRRYRCCPRSQSGASGPVARTFGGGVGGAIAVVVGVRAAPADQWHAPLVVVLAALSLLSSESERRQRTSGTHLWWWCWRRYRCCRRSQSGASGPVARTFGGGVGGAIAVVVGVRAAPADQWHAPLVVVLAALSLLSSESERRQRTSGTHLWWWCWRRYRCCPRSQSGASGPVARTFGGGVGGAIAVVVGVRAAPADQWHAPLVVVLAALSLLSSESEWRQLAAAARARNRASTVEHFDRLDSSVTHI
ncbi:hypothetical protein ACJJTC_018741 [Scirpophaga incertulas]